MPNKRWNSMQGPNDQSGGGASNEPYGEGSSEQSDEPSMPEKAVGYPGVPGQTQGKSRSGGVPTTGHAGPFYVDKKGL